MIDKNKRYKILMAEDDNFLLELYKKKLEEENFDVSVVSDIDDGFIERVINEKPDIISTCGIFPTYDGFTAAKMLKADKRTKNIPLIFLTSLGTKEDIKLGLSLGAVDYLPKSLFTLTEVVNIFLKHLNKTRDKKDNSELQKTSISIGVNYFLKRISWFKVFLVLMIFVILFVAFYWYEWRPTQAKKYCNNWALNKSKNSKAYDNYYKRCLREKGL